MNVDFDKLSGAVQRLTPWIGLVLFGVALAIVHHEIEIYHWHEISAAIAGMPLPLLGAALALTLLSYAVLCLYDRLGLEYAGSKLPYRRIALTAFLSYAISNNVGHALISGGSMRYRLYSGWGLPAAAIAKVVAFCAATYSIGVFSLLAVTWIVTPGSQIELLRLPPGTLTVVLLLAAALLAGWWTLVLRHRPLGVRGYRLPVPRPGLSLRQTLVAMADLTVAGLVLYVLLRHQVELPLRSFLLCYLLAQLLGLVSQVPGGIGVFESTFLLLMPESAAASQVLAALIVYRIIYYFVPLLVAGLLLLGYELRRSRFLQLAPVRSTLDAADAAIPRVFSLMLLLGGAVLLISGATPALSERMHWLKYALPLPLLELSHLAGSIAGVMLLIIAAAVRNRIDAGYYMSVAMLALGIVASLAKGLDYEEALVLSLMLAALLPTRKHFYRHSNLLHAGFSPQWLALAAMILLGSTWLGLFSYKHVEYSSELWWRFSAHADAPRFLRSTVAAAVVLTGFLGYRLLALARVDLHLPSTEELARAATIGRGSHATNAFLALTGDKYLLWSDSGASFVMFDRSNNYWIAMGDPVGDPAEFDELVWKLREQADLSHVKLAFYEVGTQHLPLYLDQGMALIKLGEEARVGLADFALEGKKRAHLRQAYNKGLRENLSLEIVERADVPALLPALREVSDRWLEDKKAREKRFSVGYFDAEYLSHCRIALVKRGPDILAFANLWELDSREELSIDLMRYRAEAPNGTMEFLFVALMLWGREQDFQWFNLGMAPLSGLGRHPLAPLWHRIGNTVFRLGQEFYNFEGLYRYKNKFDPAWQPRYLAAPAGLSVPAALVAATNLIAGGIKGIFSK